MQFVIQFGLASLAVLVPGLALWGVADRGRGRISLGWKVVALLGIAAALAALPWTSTTIGCPDC